MDTSATDTERVPVDKFTAFSDMEQELEALMKKYLILPDDLKKLLEIVMSLSEAIDRSSRELDELDLHKKKLEEMWLTEKNKWRLAEKSKLELECEHDVERAQFVSEKRSLEGQKADLEAKLKQSKQQRSELESELLQLKDKIADDERTRRNLTQKYRNQFETIRTASMKRATARKRQQWKHPKPSPQNHVPAAETQAVEEPPVKETYNIGTNTETLPVQSSTENGRVLEWQDDNISEMEGQATRLYAQQSPENPEGITLYEELMFAMDPGALGASKADLLMLQKEKEEWGKEKSELLSDVQRFRDAKEALESDNMRLQIEINNLQQTEMSLHQKLLEARKEADTVLSTYFNQPYKDFCITQAELLNLLTMHQNAKIQLESEREEKRRLQQQLEDKKTWFDRFREKIKTKLNKEKSVPNGDATDTNERSNDMLPVLDLASFSSRTNVSPPSSSMRQLSTCGYSILNDWIVTKSSVVPSDTLPKWLGHIQLSGIGVRNIDCTSVGRMGKSMPKDSPSRSSPRTSLKIQCKSLTMGNEGAIDALKPLWMAEVWVATSDEYSAYIEIVDVLEKAPKVRQRFLVKPRTQKVHCMAVVPGYVEPSQEYINFQSLDLSWVEETFSQKSPLHRNASNGSGEVDNDDEMKFSKSEDPVQRTRVRSEVVISLNDADSDSVKKPVEIGTPPTNQKAKKGMCRRKKASTEKKMDSTMWLITEDGRLCFYPTTDPSHVLINSIQLCQKAFCFLYSQGKVFIGHSRGLVTVYCKLTGTWILDSYRKIYLSTSSSTDNTGTSSICSDDVRCMTDARELVWIGCGASIYFLDVNTFEVKGSTGISDGIIDKIVVSGNVVIATALNGSSLFAYDIESTKLLTTISLTPLSSMIGTTPDQLKISTIIADDQAVYIGTLDGKVVVISALAMRHSKTEAADPDRCIVSAHSHLAAACLLQMTLPSGVSISEPGHSPNNSAVLKRHTRGDTMIVSVGMGHSTTEVEQCASQLCDEGHYAMVWDIPSQ